MRVNIGQIKTYVIQLKKCLEETFHTALYAYVKKKERKTEN